MPKVYVKFNTAIIKEVELTKNETTFGRKSSNDIVIDHPTISGSHGKIRKEDGHYVVEDLESTNGTFINGRKIKSGRLKSKDQIGVAGHILEFVDDESAATASAPAPATAAPVKEAPAPAAKEAPAIPPPPAAPAVPAPEPKPVISVTDTPAAPKAEPAKSPDKLPGDLEKQKELLRQALGITPQNQPKSDPSPEPAIAAEVSAPAGKPAVVKIVSGAADGQSEVHLKDLVTYIGTANNALIKITGFLVPSLAAAISRRPEGYFLKAVKPGYPKVNGNAVREQVFLENGALIEVGGTNMVFYHSEAKKAS